VATIFHFSKITNRKSPIKKLLDARVSLISTTRNRKKRLICPSNLGRKRKKMEIKANQSVGPWCRNLTQCFSPGFVPSQAPSDVSTSSPSKAPTNAPTAKSQKKEKKSSKKATKQTKKKTLKRN
jgi:hypothetical protein